MVIDLKQVSVSSNNLVVSSNTKKSFIVPVRATIMCKNNEKNDIFYRKVAFLMYTELVNFRPQSWKAASKLKPHRGLALGCHPRDNGHLTH